MTSSDSSTQIPVRRTRPIGQMSPQQLSDLHEWASCLCCNLGNSVTVQITAASLCQLLDLRGRTDSPQVRALIDVRVALLLNDLGEAGLSP